MFITIIIVEVSVDPGIIQIRRDGGGLDEKKSS